MEGITPGYKKTHLRTVQILILIRGRVKLVRLAREMKVLFGNQVK